jgi:hypothetical protein
MATERFKLPRIPVKKLVLDLNYEDFTDGGGADGTYTSTKKLPAGSRVIATKLVTPTGKAWTGDTTAVATVGKSGATDDYFGTAASILAAGTDYGQPATEAEALVAADTALVVTVTGGADFTAISAAAALKVEVSYDDLNAKVY